MVTLDNTLGDNFAWQRFVVDFKIDFIFLCIIFFGKEVAFVECAFSQIFAPLNKVVKKNKSVFVCS